MASGISSGFDVPSASTRSHWYAQAYPASPASARVVPSASATVPGAALSSPPASAAPVIAGSPVAGSSTGVTSMVMV